MPTVRVDIPETKYDVIVRPGLLQQAGAIVSRLTSATKAGVITDSNVGPLHADALVSSLRQAGIEPVVVTIPAGEQHKTLATLMGIYDQILGARIERATPILALGGGVIGDMAGFVAATALRGVPFVQVPTSLLAMVDASVGGKTGVDHAAGKNLIGAFHQPIAVLADPAVLKTLPIEQLREGLAECIKHEIIRDAAGFAELEQNIRQALAVDVEYLTHLVAHNVAIKAKVVAADPLEKGERAHLNLGHTFGHAIELVSNYTIAHGQAVSLGMTAAGFVAEKLGLLKECDRKRIIMLLAKAGLRTSGLKLDIDQVMSAMFSDKKVRGGKLRFVLPEGIGRALIRDEVPQEFIRAALESLR